MFNRTQFVNITSKDKITFENSLAERTLDEAVVNKEIHDMLAEVAGDMRFHVLARMTVACKNITSAADLSPAMKQAVENLAYHSYVNEAPFGGMMPEYSTWPDITAAGDSIREMLDRVESVLTRAIERKISSRLELHQTLKAIADLGCLWCDYLGRTYDRAFGKDFNSIYDNTCPTPEELAARVTRPELGQGKMFARTFGIRTGEQDLAPAAAGLYDSGKAFFGKVSTEERIRIIIERFDEHVRNLKPNIGSLQGWLNLLTCGLYVKLITPKMQRELADLLEKMQTQRIPVKSEQRKNLSAEDRQVAEAFDDLIAKLTDSPEKKAEFVKIIEKMQHYKIHPLCAKRKELIQYGQLNETSFEIIARLSKQPLVGNVSNSNARTFIALLHIRALTGNTGVWNRENLEKIRLLANVMAAYYNHCGHHSLLEVAEIFNRVLDWIACRLQAENSLDQLTGPCSSPLSEVKYFDDEAVPERKLPYFHPGDPVSFMHACLVKLCQELIDKICTTDAPSARLANNRNAFTRLPNSKPDDKDSAVLAAGGISLKHMRS